VATLNDEALTETTPPDYELQYIDIGNVDSTGEIHEVATYRFETAPSRARRVVRDGDVIISTVRTYLQAIAPIISPPENLIVSTGFAVVRPLDGVLDPHYCKYALREPKFMWEVEARSTGVSYPAINASDLGDIRIELAPLEEQKRIARYLDRETTEIDALIAEKERMLALLEEKRAALVSQAVTRGLDPMAPLKPSGLDWLGDIPAHWNVRRAKTLFREIDDRSESGEEELLSLRMTKGLVPHREVSEKLITNEDVVGFKRVQPREIVLNRMRAASGLVAVAYESGIVSPDYAVFQTAPEALPEFYVALFKTRLLQAVFRSESKGLGTGSQGFLRLYSDNFLSIYLPVPPMPEQHQILDFLEKEERQNQVMGKALLDSIELLKERRAALITAAVTGQIPVEVMQP
jgi:type I restriction enzyme S subunit